MRNKWWAMSSEEDSAKEFQPSRPLDDLITTHGSIRHIDNNIFFYSEVSLISCSDLNRILREVDVRLHQAKEIMAAESFVPTIHLRINSYGGDLFSSLSTVDTIRSLKSKVYTYVEGTAASAATLISACGHRRFIGKNSWMLVHQLSSICQGTFEQMEDDHTNNQRLMSLIKTFYKQYTKIPMKELDQILKRDLFMDSTTCLQHGLVDEVI